MHCVVETESFKQAAAASGMSEDEVTRLKNQLSAQPDSGDVIQGTGGARKLRVGKPGKGKSGGYRVVTFYSGEDIPVFLMDVYSKGDKINLSPRDRADLKKELEAFVDEYRESVRERVCDMKVAKVAS